MNFPQSSDLLERGSGWNQHIKRFHADVFKFLGCPHPALAFLLRPILPLPDLPWPDLPWPDMVNVGGGINDNPGKSATVRCNPAGPNLNTKVPCYFF